MAEETFYDESSAIFIAKKICNVMSVMGSGEWRS